MANSDPAFPTRDTVGWRIMIGRRGSDQASLFYEFRFDDRVPKSHLLRRINAFVTAGRAAVHEQLDCYYSLDRPAIGRS